MNDREFTDQQKYAFQKYLQGENLFITGPGGSGKSFFIKRYYLTFDLTIKKIRQYRRYIP